MPFKSSYLKMSITGVFLLGTALVIWNQTCRADDNTSIVNTYHLTSFRAAQISAFQSGGNSFSAVVDWDPYYGVSDKFGIHFNLGAALFSGTTGNFMMLEEFLMASYAITEQISAEAGPGMQQWINNGGNQMAFGVNGVYAFPEKFLRVIDRVFVGYTGVFISSLYTSEVRLGVGIGF